MATIVCIVEVPESLGYTADHEWARVEDGLVRVGITDFAQDALGDVVFVELANVGDVLEAGGPLGEVESTKSVSQLYAPVKGTVVEVNTELSDEPERVNTDPYGRGWMVVIEPTDPLQMDSLLDATSYRALIET